MSSNSVVNYVDTFIEMLSPLSVDETKFYDKFKPRNPNGTDEEILNVHGVRLYAAIAHISIVPGSTKVLEEPDLTDPKSVIRLCSEAQQPISVVSIESVKNVLDLRVSQDIKGLVDYLVDLVQSLTLQHGDKTRTYYAEIRRETHWPAKQNSPARLNPNYNELAITCVERNAMRGLIPTRYLVQRIKALTILKESQRSDFEKLERAKTEARELCKVLNDKGYKSTIDLMDKIAKESGVDDFENWTAAHWKKLSSECTKVLESLESNENNQNANGETVEELVDAAPEPEVTSEEEAEGSAEAEF